jgi:hypothetical protein
MTAQAKANSCGSPAERDERRPGVARACSQGSNSRSSQPSRDEPHRRRIPVRVDGLDLHLGRGSARRGESQTATQEALVSDALAVQERMPNALL